MTPKRFTGTGYAEAAAFLGPTKHDRPLCNNTRLIRLGPSRIAVRLHSTYIVTYHADGRQTLYAAGWQTVTTKARINGFSAARVYSKYTRKDGARWAIWHDSDLKTPPKVQRCRTCHGEKGEWITVTCYGGPWTWDEGLGGNKRQPCEHGQNGYHNVEGAPKTWSTCYRCGGEGQTDYGSKDLPYLWDGDPVDVDATGRVVGDGEHPEAEAGYGPKTPSYKATSGWYNPAPTPGHKILSGSDFIGPTVQTALADAIPNFRFSRTLYPCECAIPDVHEARGSIPEIVIHLNDGPAWTREKIADWLDTLDVDLRFSTDDPIEEVKQDA